MHRGAHDFDEVACTKTSSSIIKFDQFGTTSEPVKGGSHMRVPDQCRWRVRDEEPEAAFDLEPASFALLELRFNEATVCLNAI